MTGTAQDFPYTQFEKVGAEYRLTVGAYPLHYFHFQHSSDLRSYITVDMALGTPGPTFGYTPAPGTLRGFFRAQAVAGWAPGDADDDGIDDLYELTHGLDPLNAADASFPSLEHPGMTHLEFYRARYGLTRVTEFYSHETSVYNDTFGISVEVSVFNFPNTTGFSVEAISAEVSLFNFPTATGFAIEAMSPEVSIFNTPAFAGPSVEAISAEVSIFNTAVVSGPGVEAISPEVSVFNSFVVTPTLGAIAVEVSVLNSTP
ncbi:MAG: hypothetical protein ACKVY0_28950 [Prosthecobacter sp.]|uniref:hypothetical protein n=1 Tax=Prosthecobacter sp. TaxID=1965333 RepID=UPI00390394F8